ncbi:mitochondrial brown fat uncoupling protein 1 [Sarocladium strictum]
MLESDSLEGHVPFLKGALPFINGGISGMFATACVQPTDMIKVRIQLSNKTTPTTTAPSPLAVAREVLARGRFFDFYTGLSAAMLRQALYATARLGLFETFHTGFQRRAEEQGRSVVFGERAVAAVMAGGLAAMIGNPADLALVRMQAGKFIPRPEQAVNVRSGGVFATLNHIVRTEGIFALWTGAKPTVIRAMFMNLGQLAFFSESKAQIQRHAPAVPDTAQLLAASSIAAFFGAVLALPFDFVKTRLQQQVPGRYGDLPYRGVIDCIGKVGREEGWLSFYRGFGTFCLRVAPQTIITLVVSDHLNRLLSTKY